MVTPRRVNGNDDGYSLTIARRANGDMRKILADHAEAISRASGMAGLMLRLSLLLQEQHEALNEMEMIRHEQRRIIRQQKSPAG